MNKLSIYFALIFFVILSCKPTDIAVLEEKQSQEFGIERAKAIYDRYLTSMRVSEKEELIDWTNAYKTNFKNGTEVVFAPVYRFSGALLKEHSKQPLKEKTFKTLLTPEYLVVYIDKEKKEQIEKLFVRRTEDFLNGKGKFSGLLLYENLEGELIRGLEYQDGQYLQGYVPSVTGKNVRTSICYTDIWYYHTWSQACSGGSCGDLVYTGYVEVAVTTCYDGSTSPVEVQVPLPEGGGGGGPTIYSPDYEFIDWWNSLNNTERLWTVVNVGKLPQLRHNTNKAKERSSQFYGCSSLRDVDGSNQNAFKHALWSALNACSFGASVAMTIGLNHEDDGLPPTINTDMDIHNNGVGVTIFSQFCQTSSGGCGCTEGELEGHIKDAIDSGLGLRYITNSSGSPSTIHSGLIATNYKNLCND